MAFDGKGNRAGMVGKARPTVLPEHKTDDDTQKHHRRSIRLKGHDYALPGAYFVTVCTWNRASLFGHAVNGEMRLNEVGEVVRNEWLNTASIRPYIRLNEVECVIMPNHMHGVVWIIDNVGATGRSPLRPLPSLPNGPKHGSVGAIMAGLKSVTAKRINQMRGMPGAPVWQRSLYERAIRNEAELAAIREYVLANPARWDEDENNPAIANR